MVVKYCSGCDQNKTVEEFWKNNTKPDGLQSRCKVCWKRLTDKRRNGPKREEELRQRKNRHLVNYYGISLEEYESILARQGGKCAICHEPESMPRRKLVVDHCHRTGRVRGLLCGRCNLALGMLEDRLDLMESAVLYLKAEW